MYSSLLTCTHWLRTLILFVLGWNWWGKHWQLSLLSASLHDTLAERSRVQCHHCGSEKVKDAVLVRNTFSCRNRESSMREGEILPRAPRGLLLTPCWPDTYLQERPQKPASHLGPNASLLRLAWKRGGNGHWVCGRECLAQRCTWTSKIQKLALLVVLVLPSSGAPAGPQDKSPSFQGVGSRPFPLFHSHL